MARDRGVVVNNQLNEALPVPGAKRNELAMRSTTALLVLPDERAIVDGPPTGSAEGRRSS